MTIIVFLSFLSCYHNVSQQQCGSGVSTGTIILPLDYILLIIITAVRQRSVDTFPIYIEYPSLKQLCIVFFASIIFCIRPVDSTNENQAYERTVYLLEDHEVKMTSLFFYDDNFFSPDDTGIRTKEKTLRLIVHTGTTTPGLFITSGTTTLLDHKARPVQISPAIYSPPSQRSAVRRGAEPYGALPCPSLRGCVVLRCVLSCEHGAVPGVIRVVVCYFSSCLFFYIYLIFHGPLFFPLRKLPPYCRSKRTAGNKSTQHSWAQQGNLLCASSA